MNIYNIGDEARCSIVFTVGGVATDPTTVTFKITPPGGITTTYIYGIDAELVKDSAGHYHVDYIPSVNGLHYYRFEGTGACQTAEGANFLVTSLSGKALATLIDEVSIVLEDATNAIFSDAVITQQLNSAAIQASRYVPFETKETVTLAAASTEVDVSGIYGLKRVTKAEYPVSATPKAYRNVTKYGASVNIETDKKPTAGDTAYLYCEETHSLAAGGSTLPPEIEQIIVELAAGNCALNNVGSGRTQIQTSITALADVNTAVDLLAGVGGDVARAVTDIASIRTALSTMTGAAITDHLTEIDTELDLAKVDVADARTAFKTAADISATGASIAAMAARLQQAIDDFAAGRTLINTITTGPNAESNYLQYGAGELNAANAKFNEAQAFMQKQNNLANQLYNAANHEVSMAAGYAGEVRTKMSMYINQMNELGAAASRELSVAQGHLSIASGYLREINARLSAANTIMSYTRWGLAKVQQAESALKKLQKPQVFVTYPRS